MGEKNEIRELHYQNNHEEAVRRLVKLYNMKYDSPMDIYFILYNLALYNMKIERKRNETQADYTVSMYYLNKAYDYFKPIKKQYEVQYHNIIWVEIEINKNIWDNKKLISKYYELHNYYKGIDYKRNEIGTLINIYKLQNKYDKIIKLVYEVLDYDDKDSIEMLYNILQECKAFGDTYYNKALNIINENNGGNYIALQC